MSIYTMSSPALSSIHIYPIKSTAGIELSNSWVDYAGLSFDRRFVLTDIHQRFITARTQPKLCLIQANLIADGLILTAPGMRSLTIRYQYFNNKYQAVTVWKDTINSQLCHDSYNDWFSEYLKRPCQLHFYGENSNRHIKNTQKPVAFADGYPLLVISKGSLEALNSRSSRINTMAQFRPNLVIENCDAFAEDSWKKIRIGEVEFEVSKPCSRCIFTTIDPLTAQPDQYREPLKTLASFRKGDDGDVYFGQNLIPLNTGQIKKGDKIEVLSKQTAVQYIDNVDTLTKNNKIPLSVQSTIPKQKEKNVAKKVNILFDSWDTHHSGNNQETLLDQGEEAGLIMHYSCRGGSCGSCKVKLESGDVEQLATDGLTPQEQNDGYILACSCIPKSDVVITKG